MSHPSTERRSVLPGSWGRADQHLGARLMLPSQAAFARSLDPSHGGEHATVYWNFPLPDAMEVGPLVALIHELAARDCLLHSRYYFRDGEHRAECDPSLCSPAVPVVDADADFNLGMDPGGPDLQFAVRASGQIATSLYVTARHWLSDNYGLKNFQRRLVDACLTGTIVEPSVSGSGYEDFRRGQIASSAAAADLLANHSDIPIRSLITPRVDSHQACSAQWYALPLPAATYDDLDAIAVRTGHPVSTIALASFAEVSVAKWRLDTAAIVMLYADRWGFAADLVTCLVNPRPLWLNFQGQSVEQRLATARAGIVKGARMGYLASFEPWYSQSLSAQGMPDDYIHLSFNFIRTGVITTPDPSHGPCSRSVHQSWQHTDETALVWMQASSCACDRDELAELVLRQRDVIHQWAEAVG
jgi:hypothetical protein